MLKRIWLFFTFGALLLLVACGGNEDTGGSESSDDATTTNDGSGDVRVVEVAVPPTSKPLSWEEDGEILGYEPDILRAIDERLDDFELQLVPVGDSAAEIGLDTGKYPMIAQGLFKSDERAEKYLIPEEHNGASLMRIYVHADNDDIHEMKDLVGKKIVPTTPSGGVFNFITRWNEENPDYVIEFETSDAGLSYADRLKEVESGKYDALVLPSNLGQNEIIEQENLQIRVTDPVEIFPTYFMIHKSEENEALLEAVNGALKELKEEGILSELSIEYYGEDVFQFE